MKRRDWIYWRRAIKWCEEDEEISITNALIRIDLLRRFRLVSQWTKDEWQMNLMNKWYFINWYTLPKTKTKYYLDKKKE